MLASHGGFDTGEEWLEDIVVQIAELVGELAEEEALHDQVGKASRATCVAPGRNSRTAEPPPCKVRACGSEAAVNSGRTSRHGW